MNLKLSPFSYKVQIIYTIHYCNFSERIVMKDFVKKAAAFIVFDYPVANEFIGSQLSSTQNIQKKQFPDWTFSASRRKMITEFWYKHVVIHFLFVLSIAFVVTIPMQTKGYFLPAQIFFASLISFISLIIFEYWPVFYSTFLPQLDTIIAGHEKILADVEEIKKCRRTQFSIPTLTIIFYVFLKSNDIPLLPVNDYSAALLNNLFGADKDKLKQNLSRLYKLSGLSPKEKAEMQKGINTARSFLSGLNHPSASTILDKLELKLQNS